MSPTQKRRFIGISLIVLGISVTTFLALQAMNSSIEYFLTPTEVRNQVVDSNQQYKVAGIVKKGSVQRLADGVTQRFVVTDCVEEVAIQYTGILPDLFREGQAIISAGKFQNLPVGEDASQAPDQNLKMLVASQVLAKHDENYVPKEAAAAMMQAQANQCELSTGKVDI